MVDDRQKKKALDRQTGLLALAADKASGGQGGCLSAQEMSVLLAGRCSESERQAFFIHLASCDHCCREWLELDLVLGRKNAGKKRARILRPRFLTIGGSLLAAAASVLFFLNLDHTPGPVESLSPAPQLQLEEKLGKEKILGSGKSVRPAPAPPQKKMERRSFPLQTNRAPQKAAAPVQEDAMPSFSAADEQAASAFLQSAAPQVVNPVQLWQETVEEGCRNRERRQELWSELARQGEELLRADHSSGLSALANHVQRLAQGAELKQECLEIQRILAESGKE